MTVSGQHSQRSISRHLLVGALVGGVLVVALAGWARTTELAGAVIASGLIVVDSDVKKVQHPTGGVVSEINVRDDQQVKAGDIVLRLDDTQTRANAAVYSKSLDEFHARQARLEAERSGADAIRFPDESLARAATMPEVARILDGETTLFRLRANARRGQKAQLRERAAQLEEEIKGLVEQVNAKTEEIALIKEELVGVVTLWEKKLIPFTRVTSLKRDAARLVGERGQLIASKASAKGKITEVELQILQIDEDARSEQAEELSDVRAKIAELSERKIAAEDQLTRVDIRAPRAGRVHELAVHTLGGVITPGETLMVIVPDQDALTVEAKVAPSDVDQLYSDQPVMLRFSAFSQGTTPELEGRMHWISADVTYDEETGTYHYLVRIIVLDDQLQRIDKLKLVPGMPVEAFIQTGHRTALSYFLKPLTDQAMRTFRDG